MIAIKHAKNHGNWPFWLGNSWFGTPAVWGIFIVINLAFMSVIEHISTCSSHILSCAETSTLMKRIWWWPGKVAKERGVSMVTGFCKSLSRCFFFLYECRKSEGPRCAFVNSMLRKQWGCISARKCTHTHTCKQSTLIHTDGVYRTWPRSLLHATVK